jgi:formate C-acetyltransferase
MALISAAKAGQPLITDGVAMNVRISPSIIETDQGVERLASIIEAYFELGGKEIQINPIDTETLRDAQAHPENYPDLSVKVSGYSARFIDLSRSLQNDIIARTEFNEL